MNHLINEPLITCTDAMIHSQINLKKSKFNEVRKRLDESHVYIMFKMYCTFIRRTTA